MLNILTLVLDGAPWISALFVELNRLQVPWTWSIVEGAAMPVRDTAWMQRQQPRLSRDGTHEFLQDLRFHPNIRVLSQPEWAGKTAMCQAGTDLFTHEGILVQIDSDELWTCAQLEHVSELFLSRPRLGVVQVRMRYFVGPNTVTVGEGYGNKPGEWIRAWRFTPGMQWVSHEPPNLAGNKGEFSSPDDTGLLIDHYAYATTKQVAMKEMLYGYEGAVQQWTALQTDDSLLDPLALDWVGSHSSAKRLNGFMQPVSTTPQCK